MKPRVIRSDVGAGLTTLVPFGVSADVSQTMRRLSDGYAELARAFRERDPDSDVESDAGARKRAKSSRRR